MRDLAILAACVVAAIVAGAWALDFTVWLERQRWLRHFDRHGPNLNIPNEHERHPR